MRRIIGPIRGSFFTVLSTLVIATPGAGQGICNVLGELYVTSPFDKTLMIKMDGSADLNTIDFSSQTQFVQVNVERKPKGEFDPKRLEVGDRLCIHLTPNQKSTASRILVMKRLEIQDHQKKVFADLSRNSAFGIVTNLTDEDRTIRLKEESPNGVSQQITVDASGPVSFRHYSPKAEVGKDGVVSGWAQLKVGNYIYVEGMRASASSTIRASIIIEGGLRGFVGTITSMSGFSDAIELRQLGSGNVISIRLRRDVVFRASPFVEASMNRERSSSAAWDLHPLTFSDLQKGDTISVLAKEDQGSQKALVGVVVVTGFGSYGIDALPPNAPSFWFVDPLLGTH